MFELKRYPENGTVITSLGSGTYMLVIVFDSFIKTLKSEKPFFMVSKNLGIKNQNVKIFSLPSPKQ